MPKTFHQWQEANENQLQGIVSKVKGINPESDTANAVKQLGATNIDDLIKKLESNPAVKQVIQLTKQAIQRNESVNESVLSFIENAVGSVIKWTLNGIVQTLIHVFNPQGGGIKKKIVYAGTLLLTFLLAPYLLALGAPVGAGTWQWSIMWWFLSWFGLNVLGPALSNQ